MIELYKIEGTSNICTRETDGPEYNDPNYYPEFQDKLEWYKNLLLERHNAHKPFTSMRIGDGEYWYLKGRKVGNVGNRHCSVPITSEMISSAKNGCEKVDVFSISLYEDQFKTFKEIFPEKEPDLPLEIIYALLANKWYFQQFGDSIGLIGGEHKLNLIKRLMEHEEYRNYLGIESFKDYIEVPERFTCDNSDALAEQLKNSLENSTSKVFLYGIGMGKMALAHKLADFKNAIYIDVGCGISALAGTTALERPYFGSWTNFRLRDYDYSQVDQMDYKDTAGRNEIIL
jgi:hypothetical protein